MNALATTPALGATVSLASLLEQAAPASEHERSLGAQRRRIWAPLALFAAAIGAWCAWAPLSGAVVATGQVQTEYGRKVVQHQEGGIVRELYARQGQAVRRGEPLLLVADVRNDAALDLLRKQVDAETLRAARANAELTLASQVDWPAAAAAAARETLHRERMLFEARRATLAEQLAAMQAQQRDAGARAAALAAQRASTDRSARLARDELELHRPLVDSGYVMKTRLIPLERNAAELTARTDAASSQIAEARMQQSALANAMAQLRGAYQQRAGDELKEAGARLRELDDRLRPSQDQVERQTVRAPVDGIVMGLRVSAPGTAVGPREPLLEVVPAHENLVVELRIDPHDIDHVREGGAAEVRLAAFNARTTQLLPATVRRVSADAVLDTATQRSWYLAQVEVDAAELARHPQLRLQTGMPAEVFVTTPARSLLDYLLEPLGLFAQRALREP